MFGFSFAAATSDLMSDGREIRVRHDRERRGRDQADRRHVLERIEAEIRIEERIGDVAREDHHQRLPVGLGADQRLRRGEAVRAGAVLDDDRDAEHLFEIARDVARDHVGGAARREADQPADRTGGPALRAGAARTARQARVSAESARALHRFLPLFAAMLADLRARHPAGT